MILVSLTKDDVVLIAVKLDRKNRTRRRWGQKNKGKNISVSLGIVD
jgi:hypothetical protein